MKRILVDFLFGLLVIAAVFLLEFLVTLPFGSSGPYRPNDSSFVNREFLLAAVPSLLASFCFAWLRKPKSISDAFRESAIWTVMVALFYLFIGVANENLGMLFGSIGIYVLFACVFIGPLAYSALKSGRRKAGNTVLPRD